MGHIFINGLLLLTLLLLKCNICNNIMNRSRPIIFLKMLIFIISSVDQYLFSANFFIRGINIIMAKNPYISHIDVSVQELIRECVLGKVSFFTNVK